jgi:hypothetical protein
LRGNISLSVFSKLLVPRRGFTGASWTCSAIRKIRWRSRLPSRFSSAWQRCFTVFEIVSGTSRSPALIHAIAMARPIVCQASEKKSLRSVMPGRLAWAPMLGILRRIDYRHCDKAFDLLCFRFADRRPSKMPAVSSDVKQEAGGCHA